MKRAPTGSKSAGFTLLELMISIVLGLMLIAGAVATYLSSKRSYSEAEQFGSLSETARFAELTMSDALLHAGFFGEAPAASIMLETTPAAPTGDCTGPATSNGRGAAAAFNVERYIYGATIASTGKAMAGKTGSLTDIVCVTDGQPNSDVLIIKRAVPRPISDYDRKVLTLPPQLPPAHTGVLNNPEPLQPNTIYVLSNNTLGLLFNGSSTQPGVLLGGEVYHGTAWPYLFEVYYIRNKNAANKERFPPVLARKTVQWNGTAMAVVTEDLIEGVEDLRLRIGFDSDGNNEIDKYLQPSEMALDDWARVGSVEVYMLVRSTDKDPQFQDTKTYHMGGAVTVTPVKGNDPDVDLRNFRRLRVATQASLRNPKLVLQR